MARKVVGGSRFPGGAAATLRDHHLLLVPSTVTVHEVSDTLVARVPGARLAITGVVALGRASELSGPYELSMEDAVDAGVPMPWTSAYLLTTPTDREDPPPPGSDDRDGFAMAFPHGLPWGEEAQTLRLLIGMARRLRGAVRIAQGPLLQPDAARTVDVLVYSPTWLAPQVAHGVVSRIAPHAQLATQPHPWHGPDVSVYTQHISGMTHEQAHALHDQADEFDRAALAAADSIDAYAIVIDLGVDGAIELLVHVAEPGEPAVAEQPWAQQPHTCYEIRWSCPQPEERESRVPNPTYIASRERVRPQVLAIARVVVEVTGGIVTDEEGYFLDRYAL